MKYAKNLFETDLQQTPGDVREVLESLRRDRLWLTVANFARAAGVKPATVYWLAESAGLPIRAPGPAGNLRGRPSARIFMWEFVLWTKRAPEPALAQRLLRRIRRASAAVQADLAVLKSGKEEI